MLENDPFYVQKVNQAKGILKPFILRRLKTEVLKDLPAKIEELVYCDMTERQEKEYKEFKSNTQNDKNQSGVLKENSSNVKHTYLDKKIQNVETGSKNLMSICIELRKAANHPLLRRCIYNDDKLKQMAKLILKESDPDVVYEYVLEDLSLMTDFEIHELCGHYKVRNCILSIRFRIRQDKTKFLLQVLEKILRGLKYDSNFMWFLGHLIF